MTQERPPWFKCYPEKLLCALASLPHDAAHLYLIILLRIYEVGGPISDHYEALGHRTKMSVKRVAHAMDELILAGKVIEVEGNKIDSPTTHEFLANRNEVLKNKKRGAEIRWAKAKQNQPKSDASALHEQSYIDLDKERKKKIPKKKVSGGPLEILMVGGGLTEQTAKDVLEYRKAKKLVLTPRAIGMLAKEFFDCGDPEMAAAVMIRKNWQGFDKTWDWRPKNGNSHAMAAASGIWVSQDDARWGEFAARYREAHGGKSPPVDKRGGWMFGQ